MHKDSTCWARYPGPSDLQLVERELKVVPRMQVVRPPQGGQCGYSLSAVSCKDIHFFVDPCDILDHRANSVHVEPSCAEVGCHGEVGLG